MSEQWPAIDEAWARRVAAHEDRTDDPHDRATPLRMLEAAQLGIVNATQAGTPEGDDARVRLAETRELLARLDADTIRGARPHR